MQNISRNKANRDCEKAQLQASYDALAETRNCNNQLANGLMKLQTMVNQPEKFPNELCKLNNPTSKGKRNVMSVSYSKLRLSSLVLPDRIKSGLHKIILEQRQYFKLKEEGLNPIGKILFVGPFGSGKTMSARVLAGELHKPLIKIHFDRLINQYKGNTSSKFEQAFEMMTTVQGIYVFDGFEFNQNDRNYNTTFTQSKSVINSFINSFDKFKGQSIFIVETNQSDITETLDSEVFDCAFQYSLPNKQEIKQIFENTLLLYSTSSVKWSKVLDKAFGLSQKEIVEVAKMVTESDQLDGNKSVSSHQICNSINELTLSRIH